MSFQIHHLFAVVLSFFLPKTEANIKCYICGHESENPFVESNSRKYNERFINQIHKSCDEFDRIPLEDKYKYEMICPDGFKGCMMEVGGKKLFSCIQITSEFHTV